MNDGWESQWEVFRFGLGVVLLLGLCDAVLLVATWLTRSVVVLLFVTLFLIGSNLLVTIRAYAHVSA